MPLHPRIVLVWRVQLGLVALVITAGALAVDLATPEIPGPRGLVAVAVAFATAAFAWSWPAARYRHWRYDVGDEHLDLRHGVVLRTRSLVPHYRVQHIDIEQGPIERRLGLAKLKLNTASAATDASLPGIELDRAAAIRQHVLDRAQIGDAV